MPTCCRYTPYFLSRADPSPASNWRGAISSTGIAVRQSTSTVGRGKPCSIAIAKPPMQWSAAGQSRVLSISRKNECQASGGRSCGIGQELGVQIRQQIPVAGFDRARPPKPATLCIRKGCLAQSVLSEAATLDELAFNIREAIGLHLEGEVLSDLGFSSDPTILATMELEAVA